MINPKYKEAEKRAKNNYKKKVKTVTVFFSLQDKEFYEWAESKDLPLATFIKDVLRDRYNQERSEQTHTEK